MTKRRFRTAILGLFAICSMFIPPVIAAETVTSADISLDATEPISEPVYGQPLWGGDDPHIAHGSAQSLVVWWDAPFYEDAVMATRVDDAGEVLDPDGIEVAALPRFIQIEELDVAWNGTDYLVTWVQELQDDPAAGWGLFAARVTAAGEVSSPELLHPYNYRWLSGLSVSSDGSGFLVVWAECQPDLDTCGADIMGIAIASDGSTSDVLTLGSAPRLQTRPAITWGAGNYLLTWEDLREGRRNIYGTRVTTAGEVLDSGGVSIGASAGRLTEPIVASNDQGYFVVWQRDTNEGQVLEGRLLDSSLLVLADVSISDRHSLRGAIASDGSGYLVTWWGCNYAGCDGDINSRYVDAAGQMQQREQVSPVGTANEDSDVAWNGSAFLIVWTKRFPESSESQEIRGAFLVPGEEPSDSFTVSLGPNDQRSFEVIQGDDRFLVIWADARDEGGIYGRFFDLTGQPIDGEFVIAGGDFDISEPVGAWNGENFIVVWRKDRTLRFTLLDREGAPSFVTQYGDLVAWRGGYEWNHEVASDGGSFMVVWENGDSGTLGMQRIGPEGRLRFRDRGKLIEGPRKISRPTLAWNGDSYLLAFEDACGVRVVSGVCKTKVVAQLLDGRARPRTDQTYIAEESNRQIFPQAIGGEGHFLLTWYRNQRDPSLGATLIRGRRLNASDFELASTTDSNVAGGRWDGSRYFVLWLGCHDEDCSLNDLIATTVDSTGGVSEPTNLTTQGEAAFASAGFGSAQPGSGFLVYGISRPRMTGFPSRGVYTTVTY